MHACTSTASAIWCMHTRALLVCVPQEHHSPQHIAIDMDMHSCKGKGGEGGRLGSWIWDHIRTYKSAKSVHVSLGLANEEAFTLSICNNLG